MIGSGGFGFAVGGVVILIVRGVVEIGLVYLGARLAIRHERNRQPSLP